MRTTDLEILDEADKKTLAEWWCILNRWEWPDKIPEPEDLDAPHPRRRTAIMRHIEARIGIKECLREWNKDSLPGKAFDAWYKDRPLDGP